MSYPPGILAVVIDLKTLREDPAAAKESQRARGEDPALVDQILEADRRHRAALGSFETKRAAQREFGKEVAKAKGEAKAALVARARSLAEEVKSLQSAADAAASHANLLSLRLPNLVEPGAPSGGEEDFVVLRTEGTPRDFAAEGFLPQPHDAIGQGIAAFDTERGAKVSGSRFYYLTGVGARLELALLNLAMRRAVAAGFTPMITPTLVKPSIMSGTGFLGAHADEVYYLPADDLYLTGTSEVALAGYHSGEILDLAEGPQRLAGWSACYRREAGSYGKDTRGIFRVHQFHKVEMFVFARQEDAHREHERLLAFEEEMLRLVELPYRVIDVAAGDLGSSAARKFDCEAWIPTQARYREMTSTSNCTTFQARRLAVRERDPGGDGTATRPVATLNGTLATTRWIVAILENHQRRDGSVTVPEALRAEIGLDILPSMAAGA
ncbi:MAG: serine--tRNA ligase [Bifidobacteriaceae bacterium]|jgi:seryl-tRNA synthetase|nr:serine--tRNA ligase [Bifidobacteriaceae bacterium]